MAMAARIAKAFVDSKNIENFVFGIIWRNLRILVSSNNLVDASVFVAIHHLP